MPPQLAICTAFVAATRHMANFCSGVTPSSCLIALIICSRSSADAERFGLTNGAERKRPYTRKMTTVIVTQRHRLSFMRFATAVHSCANTIGQQQTTDQQEQQSSPHAQTCDDHWLVVKLSDVAARDVIGRVSVSVITVQQQIK